ncbi:hypothetical protein [Salinimicrobium sediminilitoris]|uniref:hypothetical protein n=1 Tax=Salinimicrobium sediminilitoris TaxID=2876715 RepID=UPI001E4D1378|nr:hypothetical protein [Salinimicrobium sediminilitoris]MCC8358909.1 hypothetical protein [Salinimicrobium sediminilitoris]
MKKLLYIISLVLISSCGSKKSTSNSVADEKFKLCSEIKYNRLVTDYGPIEGKPIYKQNIHSLFENLLLREKYLNEVSKTGYRDLLKKVSQNKIEGDILGKFKEDLEFDPYMLFPTNSFLSCYGYLFEQLNILDESDHSIWQYKFALAYNKFEAYGNLKSDSNYLLDALNKIPEKEFEKIMYRKLFLDLIFMELN